MILIAFKNGLSDEVIKPRTISNISLAPTLSYFGNKIEVKLDGIWLKQDKIIFSHGKTVNIYNLCKINLQNYVGNSDLVLGNSLFGAVRLIKNADVDKRKYSGCATEFDAKETFSFLTDGFGKNCIWFLEQIWVLLYMLITRKEIF